MRRYLTLKTAALAIGLCLFAFVGAKFSYAWGNMRPLESISVSWHDTGQREAGTFVGIVGDSWVNAQKLDTGIAAGAHLLDPVVFSRGVPGAKTDAVARLLPEVLRDAQRWPVGKRIVLIEGGINDRLAYYGANFYAGNLRTMVDAAIACGAYPVVLTIPPFRAPTGSPVSLNPLRWAPYRLLSGDSVGSEATAYTAALRDNLQILLRDGQVTIIDSHDMINPSDIAKRYSDGLHLRPEEREIFARELGARLQRILTEHFPQASK